MLICTECGGIGGDHKFTCSKPPSDVKESFMINPSHRITPQRDEPIVCESCGASTRQDLESVCKRVHESHDMSALGNFCHNCGISDPKGLKGLCSKSTLGSKPVKICVSCNSIEGHLTTACGGVMEPVHKTHSILIENQNTGRPACTACKGELGVELRQPCSAAVHSTHDWESIRLNDECSKCGVTYSGMLIEPCRGKSRRYVLNKLVMPEPKGTFVKDDILWMVYNWHDGPQIVSVHSTPEEAIDANGDNNHIGQWKIGTEFRDAVRLWEDRNNKKEASDG